MKCTAHLLFLCSLFAFTTSAFAQSNHSEPSGMNPEESIITNTKNSDNHKTLLTAVRAANLEAILGSEGPFTVFAPSDRAFNKFSKDRITRLMKPENKKELHALLTYHIVAGNITASHILKAMCRGKGKATFTTVQGDIITATMNGIDIILTDSSGNTAKITSADANQCNGVIHEIDSVILPGKI
ncbi:fasciclin domain-containing protein [Flavobacteriaceae bacterium TP-CH-4]|uniref:Fasciclin domain-containing protein n=1 Tax=Pelagihabitans pacificus TaxID=2696054 RepID=A0A967AUI0_9FLAO|nr:fasciclin domain-containing protein [Pelagihabitans pacificus]NHF59263.1 fasciclin domain-containing protein [Pelagihabitans pacificus]